MRLAFVTGNLDPGRDGVGDYARDLAAACAGAGHECALLALADAAVDGALVQPQSARGAELPTLRLASGLPWPERVRRARDWLDAFRPDWISLQFVPYALHPKGIVLGLHRPLAALFGGPRAHLMCHELWVGAERGASVKHRVIGAAQRLGVVRLVHALAPRLVHTSNGAYRALLGRAGIAARELPLCGSVPYEPAPDSEWLVRELAAAGAGDAASAAGLRVYGVFGSIHPEWRVERLATLLAADAAAAGRRAVVASIGRQGPGAASWRSLATRSDGRIAYLALGERAPRELSWFLQQVHVGLATTPWALIGKSATAAAMLDHGLPVLVSRDDVAFPGPPPSPGDPLLHRLGPDTPAWLREAVRRPPRDGLEALTTRFLADLRAAEAAAA